MRRQPPTRGERQAGDRQQALGDTREPKRRQRSPQWLVERDIRAESKDARHDGCQQEEERQSSLAPDRPEADEGKQGCEPAEEDVLLDPRSGAAGDEVGELRRVALDLRERAPATDDRACDDDLLDGDRCCGRRGRPGSRLPPVRARHARPRIPEREDDGAHRQVDLPGERDRGEGDRSPAEPPPLERQQYRWQEERDQAKEVAGRLADAVGGEREDEPAGKRRGSREAECSQPPARDCAGGNHGEQDDQVVGPDVPEQVP